jgi:Fe-S cluster assembly scaffold protein SufB
VARAELLERYRALPLPTTTDESWRFTDLKGFDPDAFAQNGHVQGAGPRTMLEIDVSGLATVGGDGVEIERAPDGIRFELLDESHPQLGELVGSDEKFAAQNAAEWKHGLLVHVPKNIVLEQPLYVRVANPPDGAALFWRLLVVAEPGSRFSLIEDLSASDPGLAGYSNSVVELFVGQEAKVEYVSLQNLARETWHFASHRARVERDAEQTNAYQENRNLLLSPKAHADSIPGLEIQANDVRCTHGATVSQVDRDQLFYAMARGLTQSDAERLILRGFFQDVLDRIELEPVREALGEALEARIPQG